MVATKDLKSFGHCDRAGSSPASSTGFLFINSVSDLTSISYGIFDIQSGAEPYPLIFRLIPYKCIIP